MSKDTLRRKQNKQILGKNNKFITLKNSVFSAYSNRQKWILLRFN